jgi:hypothetical protein
MMKNQGGDLFIVDNSDNDWKVLNYLEQWADLSVSFDIATGFFEIGALGTADKAAKHERCKSSYRQLPESDG